MAIDKINTGALGENLEIPGTEAAKMPVGTTAQRASAAQGDLRFNTTLSLMEYYDGTNWKSIDSPPVVTSVSPDNFDTDGDTITITGSNFQSGLTVKVIANDGSEFSASSVTFTNSTTASFDVTAAMVADDNDPYDVVVTNPSGLSGTLADALDFAPEPAFTVAAGTLATIYDSARSSLSFTTGATSTESDATITYAVTTGSLPSGLSIASSTGTITGSTSAVGSDTTTTFTITATATDGDGNVTTNTRQYSIVQKAPVITSYTSTGSGTFTVPTGLVAVDVLVVAGGGGCADNSGGGGAGGLIYRPAFPVTPGGSVSYTVGDGGARQYTGNYQGPTPVKSQYGPGAGTNGQNSTFGSLTAIGGGSGGNEYGDLHPTHGVKGPGNPGGSGGGGVYPQGDGGQGTQPQQPGDSGTYGFGTRGGRNVDHPQSPGGDTPGVGGWATGAGGGAGAVGGDGSPSGGGQGGAGKQYDISGSQVYYAGGGGGGTNSAPEGSAGQGGQGGGGAGGVGDPAVPSGPGWGQNGTANRGGGGGSGSETGTVLGGAGGSGIVIVKY